MYIRNKWELDYLCSSNKSYEEKINELMYEKEFVEKSLPAINVAIKKLENGSYLHDMKKQQLEALKEFKKNIGMMSIGGVCSGIGISNLDAIQNALMSQDTGARGMIYSFLLALALGTTLCGGIESIRNGAEYTLYNHRINDYQRRLK